MKTKKNEDSVRAVDRMIDILQVFSAEKRELTLTEICTMANLPKTTTYRILSTLEPRNIVIWDPQIGKYRLGYSLILLGNIAQSSNSLQRAARETMEQVTLETEQTCNLYVRDGLERMCIAQVEGTQYVRRFSYLGARFPLYCGAGKLLLAFADDELRQSFFEQVKIEKWTDNTCTDLPTLKKELAEIRKNGFSVSKGERDAMSATVSVPLYDYTKEVIASITVSGPIYFFTDNNIEHYLKTLRKAADQLSTKLGYIKEP